MRKKPPSRFPDGEKPWGFWFRDTDCFFGVDNEYKGEND